MIRCFALLITLFLSASLAASERAIIVLDASGSMWGKIDGKTKIGIARDTLSEVLTAVPEDRELGLIVYGHRKKGQCNDIELMIKPAKASGSAISAAAKALNPKGRTPLSAAVKQAAQTLRYTEDKATVILITDGLETCQADPCELGKALEKEGVDFTAHVVGFGLSKEEGQQVACLATETGGEYFHAGDATGLSAALTKTVVKAPAPKVVKEKSKPNLRMTATFTEDGPIIENTGLRWTVRKVKIDGPGKAAVSFGPSHEKFHAPGRYLVAATMGAVVKSAEVELTAEKMTTVNMNLNAARVELTGRRAAGAKPTKKIRWSVQMPDGKKRVKFGSNAKFVLEAGTYPLTLRIGKASREESVEVIAGKDMSLDFVLATGTLVARAMYAQDGPKVDKGSKFEVFSTNKDIRGKRKSFGVRFGDGRKFDLPPGDYLLRTTVGKAITEQVVAITANEKLEVQAVINAGILAISTSELTKLQIFEAKKSADGTQKAMARSRRTDWQIALPAGEYIVRATKKDKSTSDSDVSVKAGERTELVVP